MSKSNIEEVSPAIRQGEALARLRKNPDFQYLIEDCYIRDRSIEQTLLLATPHIKSQGDRPSVMEELVAVSNFSYYLYMIDQFYMAAKNPTLTDEEAAQLETVNV